MDGSGFRSCLVLVKFAFGNERVESRFSFPKVTFCVVSFTLLGATDVYYSKANSESPKK